MHPTVLFAVALIACGSADAQTYRDYVGRLTQGETEIDYSAFRLAYAASDGYAPYDTDTSDRRRRMLSALFDADDPARALAVADSVLALNYTDIDGHFISMIASRDQDDPARSAFHERIGSGLVASIRTSGEGTTPTSPWHVISVDEEYALLRYFGLQIEQQAMTDCNGSRCDHLVIQEPGANDPTDLYFDVSIPWDYLQRQSRR